MSDPHPRRIHAEDWLGKVYGAGGDTSRLRAYYDQWAEHYDADLAGFGYMNPSLIAGMACRHLPDTDAPILDAGCGTGIIGGILGHLGYRSLTGIDLSQGMLDQAAKLGIYRDLRPADMSEPLDFPDARPPEAGPEAGFQGVIASGVLTVGHAPPHAIDELLMVVRPGGKLILSVTDKAYDEGGFGAHMEALTAKGRWSPIDRTPTFIPLPGSNSAGKSGSKVFVYAAAE